MRFSADAQIVERDVALPDSAGIVRQSFRVTGIVGFLVAKVRALVGRDKPKDAYDIVWLLEAWPPEGRKEQPPPSKRASPSSAPTSKPSSSDWQSSLAMSHW